jgi:hypothetical protein
MGTLQQYTGQELIWESSHTAKRTYELRAGEQMLATLTQPSTWNQRRTGSSDEGAFTFARVGVLRQRIVITDAASGAEVANMPPSGRGRDSIITLPDGHTYFWRKSNTWGTKWTWLDSAGQPLMSLKQTGGFTIRCAVTIEPTAATEPHLALLAQLGWFQMLLAQADIVAASAATTGAAAASR